MKKKWLIIIVVLLLIALVGGAYYFKTYRTKKEEPIAEKQPADISFWPFYQNKTAGFMIKYPDTLVVSLEEPDAVVFAPSKDERWVFQINFDKTDKLFNENVSTVQADLENVLVSKRDINVGGKPAIRFNLNPGDYGDVKVLVQSGATLFTIRGDASDDNFDDMLRGFIFN